MKRAYILVLICVFMSSCASHYVEIKPENAKLLNSTELDILLSLEKDPVLTMDVFAEMYGFTYDSGITVCKDESFYSSQRIGVPVYINSYHDYGKLVALTEPDIDIKCMIGFYNNEEVIWQDTSDECILNRRSKMWGRLSDAKVCFFNYQKYLPEDTKITNGEAFRDMTLHYKQKLNDCVQQKERTTEEKELCKDDVRSLMRRAFVDGPEVIKQKEQSLMTQTEQSFKEQQTQMKAKLKVIYPQSKQYCQKHYAARGTDCECFAYYSYTLDWYDYTQRAKKADKYYLKDKYNSLAEEAANASAMFCTP